MHRCRKEYRAGYHFHIIVVAIVVVATRRVAIDVAVNRVDESANSVVTNDGSSWLKERIYLVKSNIEESNVNRSNGEDIVYLAFLKVEGKETGWRYGREVGRFSVSDLIYSR